MPQRRRRCKTRWNPRSSLVEKKITDQHSDRSPPKHCSGEEASSTKRHNNKKTIIPSGHTGSNAVSHVEAVCATAARSDDGEENWRVPYRKKTHVLDVAQDSIWHGKLTAIRNEVQQKANVKKRIEEHKETHHQCLREIAMDLPLLEPSDGDLIRLILKGKEQAGDTVKQWCLTPDPADASWTDAVYEARASGIPIASFGDTKDKVVLHPGHLGYPFRYFWGQGSWSSADCWDEKLTSDVEKILVNRYLLRIANAFRTRGRTAWVVFPSGDDKGYLCTDIFCTREHRKQIITSQT